MAVMGFDGFEKYNNNVDLVAKTGFIQWQEVVWGGGRPQTLTMVPGIDGYGKALSINQQVIGGPTTNITTFRQVFGVRNQEAYVGYRVQSGSVSGSTGNSGIWLMFGDSIGSGAWHQQFSVHLNEGNYAIEVWTGNPIFSNGTLLYATNNNVWPSNVGFYLEIHFKVALSGAGILTFKINGAQVGTATLTTQQTVNAWADVVDIIASPVNVFGTTVYIDDVYYCDTSTGPGVTPANTFLGDVRVATAFATGNDAVQFTPLANTNWQEVSEVFMDSDTSYNFDNTAGHQDTFVMSPINSELVTIYAAQVTYATRKDDAGSRTMAGVVRIGGTSHPYGTPDVVAASATYMYISDMWVLSPATGLNWTITEINGATWGYKLVT